MSGMRLRSGSCITCAAELFEANSQEATPSQPSPWLRQREGANHDGCTILHSQGCYPLPLAQPRGGLGRGKLLLLVAGLQQPARRARSRSYPGIL